MSNKYPFVEDTLGKKLQAGTGLSGNCLTCKRQATLDVAELVKRLGPDHGCLHSDLIKVIFCQECLGAGREDRNLQFTDHAVLVGRPGCRTTWGGQNSRAEAGRVRSFTQPLAEWPSWPLNARRLLEPDYGIPLK